MLEEYFEEICKRLAVAKGMQTDRPSWQELNRQLNAPARKERFASPSTKPIAPEPAPAGAVMGPTEMLLPEHLGAVMPGVKKAPEARETKMQTQQRWRTAAIKSMQEKGEKVTAAPVLEAMTALRAAEATAKGIPVTKLPSLPSNGGMKTWISRNLNKETLSEGVDVDEDNGTSSDGEEAF